MHSQTFRLQYSFRSPIDRLYSPYRAPYRAPEAVKRNRYIAGDRMRTQTGFLPGSVRADMISLSALPHPLLRGCHATCGVGWVALSGVQLRRDGDQKDTWKQI